MENIREIKVSLRSKYSKMRELLTPVEKARLDGGLMACLLQSGLFEETKGILTYVSLEKEPDTRALICAALKAGKRVAVPLSVKETATLRFYEIKSLEELKSGCYGILEPDPECSLRADPCEFGLCIVPGLSFDLYGNRLGYGKGYYDRFLKEYKGTVIGLCYDKFLSKRLPKGRYDVPVQSIITESGVIAVGAK
jgi:5-formyltetrahydrofolate cyclo-ligase